MLRVGLTGGIGSGKSVVAGMFRALGAHVIDADEIAHRLVAPGSELLKRIIEKFGEQFLKPDGSLDRQKLAEYVFQDPARKSMLEAIIHPAVRDSINRQLEDTQPQPYILIVIPLLIETGYTALTDRILVVDCSEELQIQRVLARDHRSEHQIRQIMQQQANRVERLRHADDILENNTDLPTLQSRVESLHKLYSIQPQA